MFATKLPFFPSPFSEVGGWVGKKIKKLPARCVCILRGSIYLRSKNKEIAASLLPWAWRNKQSIFAPGDLREDAHINHPACTCPKNQPQSPVSSRLGSCCCWGSPSSLNQCVRGHSELWWHLWWRDRRWKLLFHSFLLCFHGSLFTSASMLLWWRSQTIHLMQISPSIGRPFISLFIC